MKLFLDTTQRIFVATILNENDQPIFSKFVDTKYKVEEIRYINFDIALFLLMLLSLFTLFI